MRSLELFRSFLLIILPWLQQAQLAGIIAVSSLMPTLLTDLNAAIGSPAQRTVATIMTLKVMFPHHFREYQSPFYAEPRSNDLWQNYMLGSWTDQRFKESFRMSKASFLELCQRLSPWLERGKCNFKGDRSLTTEKIVAISLHRLAGEIIPFQMYFCQLMQVWLLIF